MVHREHSRHEDDIIFPLLREHAPGVGGDASHDHERQRHELEDFERLLAAAVPGVNEASLLSEPASRSDWPRATAAPSLTLSPACSGGGCRQGRRCLVRHG